MLQVKNNSQGELNAGITDSDTSLTLKSGDGAKFPTSTPFHITIDDEILEVTAVSTDTFTVTREVEGTIAAAHSTGAVVVLNETAAVIQELQTVTGTLQDVTKYADSPMIVTGGEISVGTNAGTFKVAALTALLRTTDSETGSLVSVTKAEEDNIAITAADTTYFVVLNYNAGSPTITLSTTNPYDADYRNIPIGRVMKDGSDNVHYLNGGFRFQDGVKKTQQRAQSLRNIELGKGSVIAYKDTNYFTMTAGVAFAGINRILLDAYDSSVTTFTPIYSNGAAFVYGSDINAIDYLHFDNGDGTLGDVGNGKYGVFWIYKHSDDQHVYVRYGMSGSYTLAQAEASQEPSEPDHLTDFGCLIGRIIVPQAGGEFTQIDMVTDTFFVGTDVGDHNLLGNLQGGAVDEYYHLTSAEHTIATQQATGALDGYLGSADWNTFNGKIASLLEDTTPQLGGALDFNGFGVKIKKHSYTGVVGTTTVDWTKGPRAYFTFGAGNETLAFTAPFADAGYEENLQLVIKQDATGGRTITWPANVKFAGGAPTLSTAASAIDIISFSYDVDDDVYYGVASLNFS